MWVPYSAFLSTQNGPFHVMSATPPPPPPTPIEVQGNPKGKGGGFKSHLLRSSYVGSFDLSKTSPFLVGVHTLNGMAQWRPTA